MGENNAVVLAMFGTSVVGALPDLLHVPARMSLAFPGADVRFGFSSAVLRRIWHGRGRDADFRRAHPDVPGDVYRVPAPVDLAGELLALGYDGVVVQPVLLAAGDEYRDLLEDVAVCREELSGAAGRLVVGRPLLGRRDSRPSPEDLREVGQALSADIEYARSRGAALLYMGHGARQAPQVTDGVYAAFVETMAGLYPETDVFVATVEDGALGLDAVLVRVRRRGVSRLVLKPLMVVAGKHARDDMLGPAPRGWLSRLEQEGFQVEPVSRGLGGLDACADIFVRRASDAAGQAGIGLR